MKRKKEKNHICWALPGRGCRSPTRRIGFCFVTVFFTFFCFVLFLFLAFIFTETNCESEVCYSSSSITSVPLYSSFCVDTLNYWTKPIGRTGVSREAIHREYHRRHYIWCCGLSASTESPEYTFQGTGTACTVSAATVHTEAAAPVLEPPPATRLARTLKEGGERGVSKGSSLYVIMHKHVCI